MGFVKTKQEKVNERKPKAPWTLKHVAIIMDGNRRFADLKSIPRMLGHKEGVGTLKKLVRHAGEHNLQYLTVYAFSSENWNRSTDEVSYLFELFLDTLTKDLNELHENGVRLRFIGDLSQLPTKLNQSIQNAITKTANNKGLSLQVAINYGSRLEITQALRKIASDVKNDKLSIDAIDDALVSSCLYTHDLPDPELLIRTGGEMRLSNFLLWQSAYTELYVTPVFWPEFTPSEFDKAIAEFIARQRRFGGD